MSKLTRDTLISIGIDPEIHTVTYDLDGSAIVRFNGPCTFHDLENIIIPLEKENKND